MADHAKLRDELWNALAKLPKPVSAEALAQCADTVLPSVEASQFHKWAETHGAGLLRRLNA